MWWLLAAVLVVAVIAIPLLLARRRRDAWRRELSEAEKELAWFARELLPELRQAPSREQMAGGWAVASPRVTAAEDRLTALETTGPDDDARARALALRDSARGARSRMETLTRTGASDTWKLDLDDIRADLELAVGIPPSPPV
jgi:hypothetical protein